MHLKRILAVSDRTRLSGSVTFHNNRERTPPLPRKSNRGRGNVTSNQPKCERAANYLTSKARPHIGTFIVIRCATRSGGCERSEQSGASKRVSSASERAKGRASDPVLQSVFFVILAHSAPGNLIRQIFSFHRWLLRAW